MTIKSANLAYLTLEDKFDFSLTTESGDTIECLLNEKDVFALTQIFEKVYIDRLNVKGKEDLSEFLKSCLKVDLRFSSYHLIKTVPLKW